MKNGKKVYSSHKNGLGDYEINMKIRSQVDLSGIMDLVQKMFEQSELYDFVKYYNPYFSVKRIDSNEEISQGYYEEPGVIPKKFKPYIHDWSTKYEDIDYDIGVIGDKVMPKPLREPVKDRYLTNKELAMWLAQGKGQAMDKGTGRKSTSYDYWEEDKEVDYMSIMVRKWNDKEWHKPTYHYCFGE